MDLQTRPYPPRQSWRPGAPAYFSVVPFLVFMGLVFWPLQELESASWRHIAVSLTMLVAIVTAYRFAMIWSVVSFYDDEAVWISKGVLPWNRGAYGVKWRDIESAAFTQGLFAWMTRSYPVTIMERYAQRGEMHLPHLLRGDQAVAAINQHLMTLIREAQPTAGV